MGIAFAGPTYTFTNITSNNPVNVATGISQLWFEVGQSQGPATLTFHNIGPLPCSVTDIYIDDDAGVIDSISSILNGPGVRFQLGANPQDPPGGEDLVPPFATTPGLSLQSKPPVIRNGIDPGQWLTIGLRLRQGSNLDDLISNLETGTIRVAMHVQGFASGGGESFVNTTTIPSPGAIVLGTIGTLIAGLARHTRAWSSKSQQSA
jgi:hypothetical protein